MEEDKLENNQNSVQNQKDVTDTDFIDNSEVDSQGFENRKNLLNKLILCENELKFARVEIQDWKERASRFSADMQNLTRQHDLDINQAKKQAKKTALVAIMTFVNTLNLSFTFLPNTDDETVNNFFATLKDSFNRFIVDLNNIGAEIIVPQIGGSFDPEFMNILNPDGSLTDGEIKVKQVVSCGLKIDNQLIQPANIMI